MEAETRHINAESRHSNGEQSSAIASARTRGEGEQLAGGDRACRTLEGQIQDMNGLALVKEDPERGAGPAHPPPRPFFRGAMDWAWKGECLVAR